MKKVFNTSNNVRPLIISALYLSPRQKGEIFVISADIIRGDTVLELNDSFSFSYELHVCLKSSTPRKVTKLLFGPLSVARGQKKNVECSRDTPLDQH